MAVKRYKPTSPVFHRIDQMNFGMRWKKCLAAVPAWILAESRMWIKSVSIARRLYRRKCGVFTKKWNSNVGKWVRNESRAGI